MIIKRKNQKHREEVKLEHLTQEAQVSEQDNVVSDEEEQAILEEKEKEVLEASLPKEPDIDLFDIENIDFEQRQEKRRGSRRRGYRRIDDRNLVSRAQEEADVIKKSAFDEGYRKGIEQAEGDIQEFRKNLVSFMNSSKEVFEYIAPDILEISVDIAKKIIKKEVESDPQVLINTIVDVLRTVSKSEPRINIKVRPQAVQFIKDTLPNITYQYGIDAKINIIADQSLEDGDCILQTDNGIVDASINTQLEIIKKALEGI